MRTKDATPVTFAAVLRYHRQRAADPRADRAWHAEAVECLRELAGYLGEVCRPCTGEYDGEVCSPLSVSPAEPLICPACQCAWPGLMPGRDDTVTCSCGRLLGCARRDR